MRRFGDWIWLHKSGSGEPFLVHISQIAYIDQLDVNTLYVTFAGLQFDRQYCQGTLDEIGDFLEGVERIPVNSGSPKKMHVPTIFYHD